MPMAAATPSTRRRTPRYLQISANKFIEINIRDAAYSSGLKTALGFQDGAPSDPTQIVGIGREDALENGAVPVVLVYRVDNNRNQSARVLCSPSRADTIFTAAVGQQYAGKRILKVRFPRRRVYSF